ncbi:MAG: hypothetical protein J3Q66DRAFT_375669 [Benniella sp.]|nr:MAG: hypothetical protein J3Q66DRAFT_375669 [Benniella sp.]
MPRFLILSSTSTMLTFILTLLFGLLFRRFVCARPEDYARPFITYEPCYASVEGQALYVIGANFSLGSMHHQAFVLDLSVSWNTVDPVVRQLQNAPLVPDAPCTMFNNGKDLFLLSMGTGYIYNVKSDSWKVLHNNNFLDVTYVKMATDPESGIIYIPNGGMDFSGKKVVLALNMTAGTTTSLPWPAIDLGFMSIAWCAPLGRFLVVSMSYYSGLETFTPSTVSESSNGWRKLTTKGGEKLDGISVSACFLSAYDGWKMVYVSRAEGQGFVYFLDVATLTWTRGPCMPEPLERRACAISGDQFILWGMSIGDESYHVFVLNMTSETWTSNYTASNAVIVETRDTPSSEKRLIIIIILVVGALMAIILTTICVYLGLTKPMDLDTQGASADNPNCSGTDLRSRRNWSIPGALRLLDRLRLGSVGRRPLPENPHAVIEDPTTKRGVQEGAIEVPTTPQQPHAVVEEMEVVVEEVVAVRYNGKAEWRSDEKGDH